jgi:hypothetical protein
MKAIGNLPEDLMQTMRAMKESGKVLGFVAEFKTKHNSPIGDDSAFTATARWGEGIEECIRQGTKDHESLLLRAGVVQIQIYAILDDGRGDDGDGTSVFLLGHFDLMDGETGKPKGLHGSMSGCERIDLENEELYVGEDSVLDLMKSDDPSKIAKALDALLDPNSEARRIAMQRAAVERQLSSAIKRQDSRLN